AHPAPTSKTPKPFFLLRSIAESAQPAFWPPMFAIWKDGFVAMKAPSEAVDPNASRYVFVRPYGRGFIGRCDSWIRRWLCGTETKRFFNHRGEQRYRFQISGRREIRGVLTERKLQRFWQAYKRFVQFTLSFRMARDLVKNRRICYA
ncbi:MAG: hypothetical protein Q9163_004857, partial [Psora crenata]